jgi:GAF domain-containing protein
MAVSQTHTNMTTEQESRLRRVSYLIYFVVALLAILTGVLLFQSLTNGAGFDSRILLAIGGIIGFIFAAHMVRRGNIQWGLGLVFVLGFIFSFITITGEAGHAPLLGGVMLFVFAGLIIYAFPERQVVPALLLIILAVLIFIFIDFFWPFSRPIYISQNPLRPLLLSLLVGIVFLVILRSYFSFSLRNKVFITLLIVSTLPIGMLAVINSYVTRNTLVEDANVVLRVSAIQTASDIDNFIANGLADVISQARLLDLTAAADLVQGMAVDEAVKADILQHLNAYRDDDPLIIRSVALLDLNGRVVLDTVESNLGLDESTRLYFIDSLKDDRPYVSGVTFPEAAAEPELYFTAPLQDEDGNKVGLLRATYKASILQDLVTANTGLVGGESFGVLFDENQLHLAHGRAPQTLYKTVNTLPEADLDVLQASGRLPAGTAPELSTNLPELQNKLSTAGTTPYFTAQDVATDEKINQVAIVPLRTQSWQVGYFQPVEFFLEPVNDLNRNLILFGTIFAGFIVLLSILPTRFLVQPIEQLTAIAARIAAGDLSVRAEVNTEDEIGTLAMTFNQMAGRLETTLNELEERVASRTRALETSAQVSRSVSTILDQDKLVAAVVRQVYEAFDYYNVQIYLNQSAEGYLSFAAGYGRVGAAPAMSGQIMGIGEGLIGRAAATNAPLLVSDTTASEKWVFNPQLPETRSEVAVPISIGDDVLGVLDVQQDSVDGLQLDDLHVLQTLANQVAVAMRNAGLYADIRAQAEQEARLNEITQQIQATTDIEQALQVAVRELGHATGSNQVTIRMRTNENGHSRPGNSASEEEQVQT